MILILTNKRDITADFIVSELNAQNASFIRLNTEDLPTGYSVISLPDLEMSLTHHGKTVDLVKSVRVIWNRRPGKPYDNEPAESRPSAAVQNYVNNQWLVWLEGLQLLQDVTWINHPQMNYLAENKIRQLKRASELGFKIPRTLITNDPNQVSKLAVNKKDQLIAKALHSPLIEEVDEDYFIFTNNIPNVDNLDIDEIKICPSIFQEKLSPKIDYRVTVVGENVFTVRIDSETNDHDEIDWRMQKEGLRFKLVDLQPELEDKCRQYVQSLNLLFGAIDFIEYNNEMYFLEINPNGEWGWLQKPHNIPIAESLAELMIWHDIQRGTL